MKNNFLCYSRFYKKRNLQKINEDNYLFNYESSYNSGEDKN